MKGRLASVYDALKDNSVKDALAALLEVVEQIKGAADLIQEFGSLQYIKEEEAKPVKKRVVKEKKKKKRRY